MFIRQTRTNNKATGEGYFTHRLVRGERIGGKVRQITVLNLGRHFPIKQEDWPLLCSRIEQLLQPQEILLAIACPAHIERTAQHTFAQLVARAPQGGDTPRAEGTPAAAPEQPAPDFQEVDIGSLQQTQPRSVGVEQVALHAVSQLGLVEKLAELGINGVMRAAILGNLIGRMAQPASELATWNWLQTESGLGELLDVDFTGMSHMRLYRASDLLMRHRTELEAHMFSAVQTLFSLDETATLYDLTNTYFEGTAAANPKAKHGRSKEKRADCPLLTLGLVLDGSGFVRRSKAFAGNVSEGATLEAMLSGLEAPPGALVIMDAGIATEANLTWLAERGYRYLVVRRGGARQFDETQAVAIKTAGGETLRLQKVLSEDGKEVLLYCHSEGREAKETAMVARFTAAFEAGLQKLADGLQKPRGEKRHDKLLERIGRLKEKSRGASQHTTVNLVTDPSGKVTALTWEKTLVPGTMATHPGVYCLRSNELGWDEERLWRTYSMLTDLESVFRSLKSELGLRPVFHSKEDRSDGHLFITVLAYQCVQVLRTQLKAAGINDSWTRLRQTLGVQRRVTTSMRRRDGRTIHVRKSTLAEPGLKAIYDALAINPAPGGTKKLIV
ncbi:MAG: IS1634 family transposase [Hydrogenophaga sp.]|uniref:IS1634 family transposase n=1 Tax=Hydrogenophaga sp. TaxID=1904254 RepID=UPI002AB9C55E|nr:IS1634 family transposase [Hydrogenophaga sp.]MDZ4176505.1 IS1634 family transposase [Hydrogenophaga sp.]